MKTLRFFFLSLLTLVFLCPLSVPAADEPQATSGKTRVLLITGGHEFEKEQFFKVFKDNAELTLLTVEHPNAHALLKTEAAKDYDVIVMYDFNQKISDEAKADFVARLKDGKGLVVLHHAIATYPDWPEYWKIIGARYYLEKTTVDGVEKARSAYKHGMHFTIHVADPNHPVTRGVKDYAIADETYKWFDVAQECHPLLTTDEPESNKVIAWAKTYGKARVVYMQSGHDHFAYENPAFQQVLRQAIRWTAKKS
ncbi:MAG TPA: ThuA domain-containing protein [Candidatus Binatia bacterium]|jgi:type 1 glutamine amidotransferase|nr:ThuA domain-containing protein [Candidatus Binatia bacterium]